MKYAFSGNSTGTITIDLRQTGERDIFLKIADSGRGFPENFNFSGHKSLGIQLIKLFAEQLDGAIHFENKNGAQIELFFRRQLPLDALPVIADSGKEQQLVL